MEYRIIDIGDAEAVRIYSDFVRGHANGHFLQDPAWAAVKVDWEWYGIEAWDEGLAGVMSVLIRKLPLGMAVAYAPRGPVCDRSDMKTLECLMAGAHRLAKDCRCLMLQLDPDVEVTNALFRGSMKALGFQERMGTGFENVQPQAVFRLALEGETDESVLLCFSQKTRYNLRVAQRKGVKVLTCSGSTVTERETGVFAELMRVTGERDRFLTRNADYFQRLLRTFGEDCALLLAEYKGRYIAGALAVCYGKKTWYLYGASANEERGVMPNYLLQYEMIRMALERGCSMYDFRGVPGKLSEEDPLYGLYRFKKGFGGNYVRFTGLYTHYYQPVSGRCFSVLLRLFRFLRKKKQTMRYMQTKQNKHKK